MKNFKTISFVALTVLSTACSSVETKDAEVGKDPTQEASQESIEQKKKTEEVRPYREHHFIDRHSL